MEFTKSPRSLAMVVTTTSPVRKVRGARARLQVDSSGSLDHAPSLGRLFDAAFLPGEFFKSLVDRGVRQVIGIVRHQLLRIAEDHFEYVPLCETGIKKRLHLFIVHIAAITDDAQCKVAQRFQLGSAVPQDAREVWFTGTHGDIGGGWPEAVSGLAKIPLLWMIEETKVLGLDYITQTVNRLVKGAHAGHPYVAPDALAPVNDSMTQGWKVLEYLPLPAKGEGLKRTRARLRRVPPGARVHASVMARAEATGTPPENLPPDHRVEGQPSDRAAPDLRGEAGETDDNREN